VQKEEKLEADEVLIIGSGVTIVRPRLSDEQGTVTDIAAGGEDLPGGRAAARGGATGVSGGTPRERWRCGGEAE
jgi:hypothetical protein